MDDALIRPLGRRQFLLGTVGVAATTLLAACGGDDDDDDTGSESSGSDDSAAETPQPTTAPGGDSPGATEEVEEVENGEATEDDVSTATDDASGDETPEDDTTEVEGTPQAGGTFQIAQDFGPQEMDPTISGARASTNVQELIFTCLLRWTADMDVEPDLATGWEISDDGLTYVFNLREGVTFHNGKAFAAEDVKFTFDRVLNPDTASPRISIFGDIESVDATDETTVQFNLSQPMAPLLRNLATLPNGAIVPSGASDDELNDDAPGTGPFRWVEHILDQEVRLEKFEDYYEDDLPYLDEVIFKILGDDTSISAALRNQTVDIGWLKDPKVAESVGGSTEGLESVPGVSTRYLPILFDLTQPPFDDVNVRRALSLAIDRQTIVQAVLGQHGSIGTFLPPSQLAGYTDDGSDLPYYTRDVEEAKRLLQEAGYDQIEAEFKVVAANQLDVQCAQVLAQQCAEANINITINPMEVGAILEDWRTGNYQMAAVSGGFQPDPNNEVTRFHSQSPQGASYGINDPELDALIDQGISETDEAARIEIYKQIEQHVLDQVYVITPYVYAARWELVWDYVQGYDVMPSNSRVSVRKTWLDR